MPKKGKLKICSNGHQFYKSSDCPVCPVCEAEKKPVDGYLSLLSAPARRALENANIKTLLDMTNFTENELLSLHGLGPSTIPKLKNALAKAGLHLRK
ncbi:MAG: DNA-directed RNA polymerase subunit alpha C-terminal domain-containing protein [Chitinophagales bacterium]